MRSCPNCQSYLGLSEHYFCSSCGKVLPPELVNTQVPVKSRIQQLKMKNLFWTELIDKPELTLALGKVKKRPFIELMTFIILLSTCFVFYDVLVSKYFSYVFSGLLKRPDDFVVTQRKITEKDLNSRISGLVIFLKPFSKIGQESYISYVPSTAEMYTEVTDWGPLVPILGTLGNTEVNYMISKRGLFNQSMAFFGYQSVGESVSERKYAFIFSPLNILGSDLEDFIKDYPGGGLYRPYKIGSKVVLIRSEDELSSISEAFNGVSLNLERNSKYAQLNTKLRDDGWVKFAILDTDGKEYIKDLTELLKGTQLEVLLTIFLSENKDQFVLL